MEIIVINGAPVNTEKEYREVLKTCVDDLASKGDEVEIVYLSDLTINQCIGCWSCWVKTPGECFHNDGVREVLSKVVKSDLVVFASPIVAGFISALLKRFTDRLIPLVLPYFTILEEEIHHVPRYEKRPLLGVMLFTGEDTDKEDLEIILDVYRRNSLNLSTDLAFFKAFDRKRKEIMVV